MSDVDLSAVASKLPLYFRDPVKHAAMRRFMGRVGWYTVPFFAAATGSSENDALVALEAMADAGIVLRRWEVWDEETFLFHEALKEKPSFPIKYNDHAGMERVLEEEDAFVAPAFKLVRKENLK